MTKRYSYAVGRRKEATAVVKMYSNGKGNFSVRQANGKVVSLKDYFGGNVYMFEKALAPFKAFDKKYAQGFDADIVIRGGGIAGQADAIKLWFARALVEANADARLTLKPLGLLKRDGRIKERKKPGLRKARKSPTWSKR